MRSHLLEILACPQCQGTLSIEQQETDSTGNITAGSLRCSRCQSLFPIQAGIPRFIPLDKPDSSFGYQWNQFRQEQLDSWAGAGQSAHRFWSETDWTPSGLAGERVLDVGCGAGRFLEVVSSADCDVIGIDPSSAIDASAITVRDRTNVDLVQADMFNLPFRSGVFDSCYCIGVAQHTPAPIRALSVLPRVIRPGGRLAVTVYERRPWTWLNGKYLLRPITRRMPKQLLMALIKISMPVAFPLTELLFRLPIAGPLFAFAIPVANYVSMKDLPWQQRYRVALLDTFDRLSPEFDRPFTEEEVRSALGAAGIRDLRRLRNTGVNIVGVKDSEAS